MTASLRAGKVVTLPTVGLFADGAAVKTVGKETFNICHQLVDEMITVQTGGSSMSCACNSVKLVDGHLPLAPVVAIALALLPHSIAECFSS